MNLWNRLTILLSAEFSFADIAMWFDRENTALPMKYASRMASRTAAAIADKAAHFQLQYLEGFFSLNAFLENVFLGNSLGGGV